MGKPYQPDPNAGATLFVNLFILLLAFFVVLVALSEIVEERSEQAINSIAEVFSITVDATEDNIDTPQNRASGISSDHILRLVRTIIESQVKVIEPETIDSNSNSLSVRYSLVNLFQSNSSFIRPDQLLVLRRIAHSVSQAIDPIYTIIIISTPIVELAGNFSFGVPQSAQRVDHLINLLIQEGIPDHLLQGSITNEEGEYVEFRFYVREEDLPNIKIIPNRNTQG